MANSLATAIQELTKQSKIFFDMDMETRAHDNNLDANDLRHSDVTAQLPTTADAEWEVDIAKRSALQNSCSYQLFQSAPEDVDIISDRSNLEILVVYPDE